MRVIAGSAKRIRLEAPKGFDTRPTSDRAKEGLFNILADRICGSRFLDLYSGSGAIGIEALSRGAGRVVFVDSSGVAACSLRQNLMKTKLEHCAEVLCMDAFEALQRMKGHFDFIFFDPPYKEGVTKILEQICQAKILSDDGLIIAETDARHIDNIPSSLYLMDMRRYGRVGFFILCEEKKCAFPHHFRYTM